jgi:hypothetical protein
MPKLMKLGSIRTRYDTRSGLAQPSPAQTQIGPGPRFYSGHLLIKRSKLD